MSKFVKAISLAILLLVGSACLLTGDHQPLSYIELPLLLGMVGLDDRLAYGKREAAGLLGIGETKLMALIANGIVRAVKSGKIVLIPRDELKKYLASLPPAIMKDRTNSPEEKRRREAARAESK